MRIPPSPEILGYELGSVVAEVSLPGVGVASRPRLEMVSLVFLHLLADFP